MTVPHTAVRNFDWTGPGQAAMAATMARGVAGVEGASPPRSGRAALEPALALALRVMAEDGLPPALVG